MFVLIGMQVQAMLTLAEATEAASKVDLGIATWIITFPALGAIVCGILSCFKPLRKFAAAVTILSIFAAFVTSMMVYGRVDIAEFGKQFGDGVVVHYFNWIRVDQFIADFSFYIDPLTLVMLLVVTGIGTLIAIYASGYMQGDPGYSRFFAYIALFITSMTILVLADNLLLLYLGWEGVGLCSYLLIGYYYRKPSAVAAAKKAFIVNRVGDFGFALGLMLIYVVFGSIQFSDILPKAEYASAVQMENYPTWMVASIYVIPFLLMLGAFGKSAQLPLHVWLPDAMEGPTPVSALIHAATMVTAGVYMISRLLPVFELSPYALPTVATIGGLTALFAATIALCQYDIKRVWAYSTVSQLGYMFLGVGVLCSVGAVFHLLTHAFFKALLFLTAGSVMHAMAGQLDLRKMSGLRHKMPITAALMFIGCLALAGVPFTPGWYSKDLILVEALMTYPILGVIGLVTALLTAFYTFRLWFRVFTGEEKYEMGREHHGYEVDHPIDDHHHAPHEMPWLMNGPLVLLAIGSIFSGMLLAGEDGWMASMVNHSSAAVEPAHGGAHGNAGIAGDAGEHGDGAAGHDLHHTMHLAVGAGSGLGALLMIGLAWFFHCKNRELTDKIAQQAKVVVKVLNNKWYIDEIYNAIIVTPLRILAYICYLFDRLIIDGLVGAISMVPKGVADTVRPTQSGFLHGYARWMAFGVLVIVAYAAFMI